ncbi:carbohydrate-binding module family 48 protein [Trichoderma sp. SZMC 28013]
MGSYTFKWEHPAEEVFVTGTFDNWTKSEQLAKEGDVFQKTVALKDASQKIYFKYVVDGNWTVNESSPKEADHEGNVNNFITPEDILKSDPAAAFISTVTPQSTTAKMASEQPVEKPEGIATPSDVPGGFPATPQTELDKPISVNPLPAAAGAINPIQLAPGEEVPTVGIESTNEHVKLDKESYEKSDALPGVVAADLPPVTSNLIPESSLPVTAASEDVHINTVGAGATTVGLAAQVPLEAKVPEVVKESLEKANAEPEAAAVPAEVEAKAKVEEELKEKVTEAPVTSEDKPLLDTEAIAAAAATTGAAVVAAVIAAKDSLVETAAPVASDAVAAAADAANKNLPDSVKEQLPEPVKETLAQHETAAKEETREEVSPEVPAEVKESITEAGKSPEAAANTVAVEEKKAVEAELLKEVKPVAAVDEPKVEETKAPAEVPVTSATITDVAAIDSPVTEVSNVQVTKTEVPVEELTKAVEEPKAVVEEPKTEVAKTEAPAPIDTTVASEAPKADATVDTPVTETDKTEVPPVDAATEEPAKGDAANGTHSAHSDKASEKKKNRFSAFFSRFSRHKASDKN